MYTTDEAVRSSGLTVHSLEPIKSIIGNTSLYKLPFAQANLFTKLEYENCFGSIKDRPALYIVSNCINNGMINEDTTIIESTSGNFGIALAGICKAIGLKFIAVIDPNISRQKEQLLRLTAYDVIKVKDLDETGAYLLTRIRTVQDYMRNNGACYNPNQYENTYNYLSYFNTLGVEICDDFEKLDFAFISVSSGGTIIGLSQRLKEKFPDIKIIGVDVDGSMVFSDRIRKRKLSGIGAGKQSVLIHNAIIDDVVILSERDIISGCMELMQQHNLFAGASAGAAYLAAKRVLLKYNRPGTNAIFITPDNGISYLDTVYNKAWVENNIE